ncbi:MAG: aminodeoxychorismate synthase component I [Sphingosinicella sp.]|nr:aminodeoxychorismate synthase component I [Sphingosinicella sp.]
MLDAAEPFILFDDNRGLEAARARLYRDATRIIQTRDPDEIGACLQELRNAQERGLHGAGFIAYEAGHSLDEKLCSLRATPDPGAAPLLWFGLFERYEEILPGDFLPDPKGAWSGEPIPRIEPGEYQAMVMRVKAHIEAGDIYQANLTFAARAQTQGHPLALYASIRGRAQAGHGALLFTGDHWFLSFSPELFFTLQGRKVTARPMKGTATRHPDPARDSDTAAILSQDPKQRAENLMIVDLLRNDLSRVSKPGSVEVPSLFTVETYPTVHQLTSTITSELEDGLSGVDVIEAIFPCGSITGAPKLRAMEIIGEVETGPRNIYTGSIGWLEPNGDASFNVAIRTLVLKRGETVAAIGLGSGIVADSHPDDEWRECLAKGVFVKSTIKFDLIETMRFDPHEGIAELERHLARMKRSALELDFPFDRHAARNDLQAATFRLREPRAVRLLLSRAGNVAIESRRLPPTPAQPATVAIVALPVRSDDFRLRHKTSDRSFYDNARRQAGTFETVFEDPAGFLTEGSFTNIFVERDGGLLTPPSSRGLLPGILREKLIDEGLAEEADLRPADLVQGFLIGNAIRGVIRARMG